MKDLKPVQVGTLESVQGWIVPALILASLGLLWFVAVRLSFSTISSQRTRINEAKQSEEALVQKDTILKEVSLDTLASVEALAIAVPEKNPALAVVSQVRNFATERGFVIGAVTVGRPSETEDGFSKVNISFEVVGNSTSVIEFSKELLSFSPIVTIEDISIVEPKDGSASTVNVATYWSSYPEDLPALTTPIEAPTRFDSETLSRIVGLNVPEASGISPSSPTDRADPFN